MLEPKLEFVECPQVPAKNGGVRRMAYWRWDNPNCRHPERWVVCMHGLTRQGRDFDVLARTLSAYATVVCPDVAGRGESDWLANPSHYSVATYVPDMLQLLSKLGITQCDWVGTSMGGLIGMGVAALPQSPIQNLILNDVGPSITKSSLQRIASYVGKAPPFDSLEAGARYLREVAAGFGPHSDADWLALSAPMLKRQGESWVLHYDPEIAKPLAMLDLPNVDELLAQGEAMTWAAYDAIEAKTLVLRGGESDLLTPESTRAMAQRGPRAKVVTIEGVGHAPTLIAADQQAVVLDFLGLAT